MTSRLGEDSPSLVPASSDLTRDGSFVATPLSDFYGTFHLLDTSCLLSPKFSRAASEGAVTGQKFTTPS